MDKELESFVDLLFNFDETELKREIDLINRMKDKKDKIFHLLDLMISSDPILKGEYFVIHSDLVFDLIGCLKGEIK